MPKRIIPKQLEYKGFTETLLENNFISPRGIEEYRDLKKKKINLNKPPRVQKRKGDIYVCYTLNGYRVKVQTGISNNPYQALVNSGWVLIENEQGSAVMYAPRHHKTKNYLENILISANILKQIAFHRPLCQCGSDMNIEKIPGSMRDYQYVCSDLDNPHYRHTEVIEVYEFIWNKISSRLRKALRKRLSKESYNRYMANSNGKNFGVGVLRRKSWKTG